MRISDWSSDVCSSDLLTLDPGALPDRYGIPGRQPAHRIDIERDDRIRPCPMDLFDFDAALGAAEQLRWVVFEDEREIKFLFDLDPALDIDGATEVTVYRLAENGSRCGLRLCWRSGKANRARLAEIGRAHV